MSTETNLDLFTTLTEDLDLTPNCESRHCSTELGKPVHGAEWFVTFTCGCANYWCSDRLASYQAGEFNQGMRCYDHSPAHHVWLTGMTPVHP